MAELQRAYYAIIPANVRYDKDLTANAKLLYGEITALCNERGYCWATNSYFAELYSVSTRTVAEWISQLNKKKYIHVEMKPKGNKTKEQIRIIYITPMKKTSYPHEENFVPPMKKTSYPHEENFAENNTSNNTSNNSELVENKDERTDELSNLIKFCNNNVEILTPFKCQMLEGYVDDYGIEWVQRGLEKLAGLDRTKQNVKYLGGVLKGWKKDGVPKPWESDQENKQQSSEVMHDDFGDYEMIDGYKVYL